MRGNHNKVVIAVDCVSGDNKDINNFVNALKLALLKAPYLHLIVFGSQELQKLLSTSALNPNLYDFYLAPQDIPQDEQVNKVLKNYNHSAMYQAIQALATHKVQAVVSLGGTGPLVCLARHLLGVQSFGQHQVKLKETLNIKLRNSHVRPCFVARLPNINHQMSLMLDVGANANAKAEDLYDFAILGQAFAKVYLKTAEPKISLLNVGQEQGKGSLWIQQAQSYLQIDKTLNYSGFIEANNIFSTHSQVIVCDGFSGNIALKAMEGVCATCFNQALWKKILFKFLLPKWFLPKISFSNSILLGVNGLVIKAHASCACDVFAATIVEAAIAINLDLVKKMQDSLLQESD